MYNLVQFVTIYKKLTKLVVCIKLQNGYKIHITKSDTRQKEGPQDSKIK